MLNAITKVLTEKLTFERSAVKVHIDEVDGVRGWTALDIVVFHSFWETFGVYAPQIRNIVSNFFMNGIFTVDVFFLMSGMSLSISYFAGGGRTAVEKLAIKRYPRLFIPIISSCFIVYLLYKAGLVYNVQASEIVNRPDWFGAWLKFPFDFLYLLKYSLADVFIFNDPPNAVIPFLWTMRIELLGSFLIFILLWVLADSKYLRLWLLGSFIIFAAIPNKSINSLSCFIAGAGLADIAAHGGFKALQKTYARYFIWAAFFAVGFSEVFFKFVSSGGKHIAAVLLLAAVFSNKTTNDFFTNRASRFLGKISFSIYLVQLPVIVSVSSWAIIYAHSHNMLTLATCLGIATMTVTLSILGAVLFNPVEVFTKYSGNKLVQLVMPYTTKFLARFKASELKDSA